MKSATSTEGKIEDAAAEESASSAKVLAFNVDEDDTARWSNLSPLWVSGDRFRMVSTNWTWMEESRSIGALFDHIQASRIVPLH